MLVKYLIYRRHEGDVSIRPEEEASLLNVLHMIGGEEAVYLFDRDFSNSIIGLHISDYTIRAGIWYGYEDGKGTIIFEPIKPGPLRRRRIYYTDHWKLAY